MEDVTQERRTLGATRATRVTGATGTLITSYSLEAPNLGSGTPNGVSSTATSVYMYWRPADYRR